VRVISPAGEQLGVLATQQAMQKAQEYGLDLVEVAPNANPPVCKILDFGKYKYEKSKKEKQNKKGQQTTLKVVKLTPNIGEADLLRKIKNVEKFLEKGCRVQVEVRMKGRQHAHSDIAVNQVQRIMAELQITPEGPIQRQGSRIIAIFANATETPQP
jgi:translation initiation factor IF-3